MLYSNEKKIGEFVIVQHRKPIYVLFGRKNTKIMSTTDVREKPERKTYFIRFNDFDRII